MARLIAVVAATILVAALVAGCGGASSTTSSAKVTATTYVTALCQAVAPFEKDVATRSRALTASGSLTAAAGKRTLVSYLGALSTDSAQAVTRLKVAGAPQVNGGASFAAELLRTFTRLNTALERSERQASQLSTSDAASFKTGATRLSQAVEVSVGALGAGLSTRGNQALDRAAAKVAACHAL